MIRLLESNNTYKIIKNGNKHNLIKNSFFTLWKWNLDDENVRRPYKEQRWRSLDK